MGQSSGSQHVSLKHLTILDLYMEKEDVLPYAQKGLEKLQGSSRLDSLHLTRSDTWWVDPEE
jgi:hypothetical protein